MAIRYPLVIAEDGQIRELPEGDSLFGSGSSSSYASQVIYDPAISGYPNNVQAAIDEIYNSNTQLADTGVTYGHVSDAEQTFYGQKSFLTRLLIGTNTWDTVSALQVEGRLRTTGPMGIGTTTNTQTALRIDYEVSGDAQSGIRNYTKFTATGSNQFHGYTSDLQVAAGVPISILYHASYGDGFNLGTVQTGGYLRMAAPTNANYTSFFGIVSGINSAAYDSYFIRHIGTAKSTHLGSWIVGTNAWDAASKLQVVGDSSLGKVGIGGVAAVNAALRIYNDLGLSTTGQTGIKNYFQPSAEATATIVGYESDVTIPAGVTSAEYNHLTISDVRNSGTIATYRGIVALDTTKTYGASATVLRSFLQGGKAYPTYFLYHSGSAPSNVVGNFILGSTDASDGWSKLQLTGNTKYTGFETYAKSQTISASVVLPANSVTRCYDSCEISAGVILEVPAGAIFYIE